MIIDGLTSGQHLHILDFARNLKGKYRKTPFVERICPYITGKIENGGTCSFVIENKDIHSYYHLWIPMEVMMTAIYFPFYVIGRNVFGILKHHLQNL